MEVTAALWAQFAGGKDYFFTVYQMVVKYLLLLWPTVQQLEFTEDLGISVEDQQWAKRFASRHNFGFGDSDDEDDWESADETYVVC